METLEPKNKVLTKTRNYILIYFHIQIKPQRHKLVKIQVTVKHTHTHNSIQKAPEIEEKNDENALFESILDKFSKINEKHEVIKEALQTLSRLKKENHSQPHYAIEIAKIQKQKLKNRGKDIFKQ